MAGILEQIMNMQSMPQAPTGAQKLANALRQIPAALTMLADGKAYGTTDPNNAITDAARANWWRGSVMGTPQDVVDRNRQRALAVALAAPTVYHGSPHLFDKFDMSKVGTGEGAQAYGHGLYFAENPGVAMQYRSSTSDGFGLPDGNVKGIATLIAAKGDAGEQMARKAYAKLGPSLDDAITQAKQAVNNKSSLYTVDLPDSAVSKMLDWDKPLSQQPGNVKQAIENLGIVPKGWERMEQVTKRMDEIGRQPAEQHFLHPEWSTEWNQLAAERQGLLGAFKDHPLSRSLQYGNATVGDLYQNSNLATSADAAKQLLEAGVPGIRYLDGGSRAAGQGTSNYVVFDDTLPKILKRE